MERPATDLAESSAEHPAAGPNEIQTILEKHQEWLNAVGTEGTRASLDQTKNSGAAELKRWLTSRKQTAWKANLCRADLREANLKEANLQGIDFLKADLRGADLDKADLRGVNLRGAQLQGAGLLRTVLREANLRDADLSEVKGLQSDQLAGANLSGAKLPEAISKFEPLGAVKERSQNAKKVLLSLLLACTYVVLTVATTTDVGLITKSSSSELPIIRSAIPIVGFYGAAPLILVSIYLYLLLYLHRLWESMAKLPAVFPDGTPLDEKVYPWLPNSLVASHFALLKEKRPALSGLQSVFSRLFVYWVVPITLASVWVRYLTRQDWALTRAHIALLVLTTVGGIMFRRLAGETLEGTERQPFDWSRALTGRKTRLAAYLATVLGGVFWTLSYGAIEGVNSESVDRAVALKVEVPQEFPGYALQAFELVGYNPFAELSKANLHEAELPGAKLRNARLGGADLRDTNLTKAWLQHGNLEYAKLEGATLESTDLRWANMSDSELDDAILYDPDLEFAVLEGADLTGANLSGAKLKGAILEGAILECADFRDAKGLVASQVAEADYWEKAFYDHELLVELSNSEYVDLASEKYQDDLAEECAAATGAEEDAT